MNIATAIQAPLINRLWPAAEQSLGRQVLLAVFGTILFWASAKVQVPMYPVPMTMQTFVMLVVGMTYGSRLASATVGLYLLEGAIGLPVFAGGGGLAYMMGTTGGYLAGFLISAFVIGLMAERGFDRTVPRAAIAMAVGTVLQLVPGVLWLAYLIGWERAIAGGLTPFLAGAAVKLALAACVVPVARRAVEARTGQM